jgi:Rrf2 family protein
MIIDLLFIEITFFFWYYIKEFFMQLTNSGEYAIRALMTLASRVPGDIVSIETIAKGTNVPENFLRKIIQPFVKAGFIHSIRGVKGGITLARPANEINLLEIVEIAQGPIFLNKCLGSSDFCDQTKLCSVHLVWEKAQESLLSILRNKNLASLVAENKILASGKYKSDQTIPIAY